MITVSDVSLQYGGTKLFKDVNLKFTPGKSGKAMYHKPFKIKTFKF